MKGENMNRSALEGIKIIDLTAAVAGPYCCQLLADFGANVLKIEPPKKGDMLREVPPFIKGESSYFLQNNRNKRSMTLDIKKEKGLEVLKKLIVDADVLVENYRPNVKKKLKIDYDTLVKINPRLVYCSISGFGQSGPYADRPGFDPIAQGMSGLCSVTGWKNTGPVRVGVAIGDSMAGIFGAYGILLALIERGKSGKGQRVETSLLEGLIAILGLQAAKYFATEERPEAEGNDHPMLAPFGTFQTKDGYLNIAAGYQAMWERLAKAVGLEHLLNDERFLAAADRMKNKRELINLLEEKLKAKTNKEWEAILNEAEVPNGPILYIDEVFKDPHVLQQEMLLEMNHPSIGIIKMLGFPTKLSRTPATLRFPPPLMGQHTEDILRELGYGSDDIESMGKDGVY